MQPLVAKLVEALTSKKLWATVIAAVCAYYKVDPEVIWTLMGYVGAQSLVDAAHHLTLPSPKAPPDPQQEALAKVLKAGIEALNRQAEPVESPSNEALPR